MPTLFVGGQRDWGTWSAPGAALDAMKARATTALAGVEFIDGAGHWIQQERPEQLGALLLAFAGDHARA